MSGIHRIRPSFNKLLDLAGQVHTGSCGDETARRAYYEMNGGEYYQLLVVRGEGSTAAILTHSKSADCADDEIRVTRLTSEGAVRALAAIAESCDFFSRPLCFSEKGPKS